MIFGGLHRTFATIPMFSYDAGVVYRPSKTKVNCAFGRDGAVDDLKPRCREGQGACVPGCGSPPNWCDPEHLRYGGWHVCGFTWDGAGGLRPWRPEDLGKLLDEQANNWGADYKGIGNFKGYNEVVVRSRDVLNSLPSSIEAIFLTECNAGQSNLDYQGRTAPSCAVAHERGRSMYQRFLAAYGLSEAEFPLLMLRPDDWVEPFVLAP